MLTFRSKQFNYYIPNKKPSKRLKNIAIPKSKIKKNYLNNSNHAQQIKYAKWLLNRYRTNKLYKIVNTLIKFNKYRKSVIAELIKTEINYVKDLDIIITIIMPDLSQFIPQNQLNLIFSNILQLHKLNNNFLTELTSKFTHYHPYSLLGKTIIQFIPFFKIYFQYYKDFDKSCKTIDHLMKNNKQFSSYVSKMSNQSRFHHLDLESFLVKPVQRLPKYVLLIKDLIKHTFQDHPDYENLTQVYQQLNNVTEENNQKLDLVHNQAKIFDLQRMFGNQIQLLDSKRKYYQERLLTLFWRNTGKSVIVHFLSNLILVTERKDQDYSLISSLHLNSESLCKDVCDTQYFTNLFTIVAQNETLTFIGESQQDKQDNMQYIQKLIDRLKEISQEREVALSRNRKSDMHKKDYVVTVQVVGTEQRSSSMFTKFTVYIVDISIENITQKIYLRYSECLELQEFIKKEYPTIIQFSYMQDGNWKNKNDPKEVEARSFQISNFLQSILNNKEVRKCPQKVLEMSKLPMNFYFLPDLLQEEKKQERLNHRMAKTPDRHQKKYSATHLIRLSSQSSNKMRDSKKLFEDYKITVHTFHPKKSEFDLIIQSDQKIIDLFDAISTRLQKFNLFDFKLMIMENIKSRKFKILEDDELLQNIFGQTSILSKLMKDKKEIYLRKVLFLDYDQEQMRLKDDPMKAQMICNQLVKDIFENQFDLDHNKLCQLASFYLHFQDINIRNFDLVMERLQNFIPTQIFKQFRKETWFNKIKERYILFSDMIEKLLQDQQFQDSHLIARLTFLSTLSKNSLFGQHLFQCQQGEAIVYLGVNVDGFTIFDSEKKMILETIYLNNFNSLKVYPATLVIQNKEGQDHRLECQCGYQVQTLFQYYQEILEQLAD